MTVNDDYHELRSEKPCPNGEHKFYEALNEIKVYPNGDRKIYVRYECKYCFRIKHIVQWQKIRQKRIDEYE